MLPSYFVYIGSVVSIIGTVAYIIDTIRGRVKPNRVSFLMWSIAPLIAFAAQFQQGVGPESILTFVFGIMPLVILVASFLNKKAEWKLSRFDVFCGLLSLAGLSLWLITKVGNVAIFFSIVADALAAIPTVIKAYKYPETELAWPWLSGSLGVLITLLTINHFSFANSGFIFYVMVLNAIIFAIVHFKLGKKVALHRTSTISSN